MSNTKSIYDDIADRVMKNARGKAEQSPSPNGSTTKKKKLEYCYWEYESNGFYLENYEGIWLPHNVSSFQRHLRRIIFRHISAKEGRDDYIDDYIIHTQARNGVGLAMPLAGYPIGVHDIGHERILVTKEAKPMRGRAGEWPTLRKLIESLLPGQTEHLYGWLKSALEVQRGGPPFRPGQLLAIAGPGGCGKSYFQNLITLLFGGRMSKPFELMMGEDKFGSELFHTEHLMIEDEAASTSTADRIYFGTKIKNLLMNETQKYHRKFGEPLALCPCWRMSCTLNDNPESLLVMPPIDEDLHDKIIFLLACRADFSGAGESLSERKAFHQRIVSELPAFVSFLSSWKIPAAMKDQRFGVKAWQHPELLDKLSALAPQTALLTLIDSLMPLSLDGLPFEGYASELEEKLLSLDKLGRVTKLLKWSSTCGSFLGRLAKSHPSRVKVVDRVDNTVIWHIAPSDKRKDKPIPQ